MKVKRLGAFGLMFRHPEPCIMYVGNKRPVVTGLFCREGLWLYFLDIHLMVVDRLFLPRNEFIRSSRRCMWLLEVPLSTSNVVLWGVGEKVDICL